MSDQSVYSTLLRLCQQQVKALDADDFSEFDCIILEKSALITTLAAGQKEIMLDPALQTIAIQIQELDLIAQKILFRKAGKVMSEMATLQRHKNARQAYRTTKVSPMQRSLGSARSSSYFIDQKS